MHESSLNAALRHFEVVEANLVKIEKVLAEIGALIPEGIAFLGDHPEFEDRVRDFDVLIGALPKIDGWKPQTGFLTLDEIARGRLDAMDIMEADAMAAVEQEIRAPFRAVREYRHRFEGKRNELIRAALEHNLEEIDLLLSPLKTDDRVAQRKHEKSDHPNVELLKTSVSQIDTLLGSNVKRPERWSDLRRHLNYGEFGDLYDIIEFDWPNVKAGLRKALFGEREPIAVEIEDIGDLVRQRPTGPVATKLRWRELSEEEFKRLLFTLISSEAGYENPTWLTKTNAVDNGRDLSVFRVHHDALGGTIRQRVIVQCKHWLTKSVGLADVSLLRDQMKLWEPPRIDVHVIATTGRFSTDAVTFIETHNQANEALRIEMWPESPLELLLARRPSLIAEFALR